MEALIPMSDVTAMVSTAVKDPKAELEVKLMIGQIRTKDVADRIVAAIESITNSGVEEQHRASFSYADGKRVMVFTPENIHKVCTTNSFRGVPLEVERKRKYYDIAGSGKDVIDIPELKMRATLRSEEALRKDFTGSPTDPANHIRILHRKSWKTSDGLLQIDFSLVKSKTKQHRTFADILKQTPSFELEIEVVDKTAQPATIAASLVRHAEALVGAFQGSPFILPESDMQRYDMEFNAMKMRFINPVTMERQHMRKDRPHNILSGYTVTNKADGERSLLVVMKDRKVIRITKPGTITWTGLTAKDDKHAGDVVDGEYIAERNLYCIFDVYKFRTKNVMRLPLMTTDDDIVKNPLASRLGCAHEFIQDLRTGFVAVPTRSPVRIETKLFLAGEGPMMERAIAQILDTKFEYETDGLIFTPKSSAVAPIADSRGNSWIRVYKWKPAEQNSIDFLVRFAPGESYDPITESRVFKGRLFVSRTPGSDIVYPCETITGEYVPPELPQDMQRLAETRDRVPSPFQPSVPKSPDAAHILLRLNARGVPVDQAGQRIEDNTIIECARDTERGRWTVMRTRYDKTYEYRVLGQPNYGNDIYTAESIWTNIHNPVTEEMIRMANTSPPDDTFEDDLYYRDEMESHDRVLKDVRSFHNRIKESLYTMHMKPNDSLLELAVGRGGDLHKWRKLKPSKVVGIDLSKSNLDSPRQGACVRYLKEKSKGLPPALFIQADMTQALLEQDNKYLRILAGTEPAPTPYLQQFAGLSEFDAIACQFALHYACESEEQFRTFVGNLTRHGKGVFFGTCMDGAAVYSLLLGKNGHMFRSDRSVFGELAKDYGDGEGWTEEFGKAITVKLESFERPVREFLVPFGRVTEILQENGFVLLDTRMFADHYAQQTDSLFTGEYQTFSFLHRSFAFRRKTPAEVAEERRVDIELEKVDVEMERERARREEKAAKPAAAPAPPAEPAALGETPEDAKVVVKAKKRLVKIPIAAEPLPEPVFFFTGNPALNEFKEFSTLHEAPMQVDGITFPTVEHYVQWSKAKMFGDTDAEAKILKTPSSKSVRGYGNKIKEFKEEEWNTKRDEIMRKALRAKFVQHPELRTKLLATGTRPIAEADPREKYWAIGTSSDTSKAKDPTKWPGKNMLGKMLEELRTELKE